MLPVLLPREGPDEVVPIEIHRGWAGGVFERAGDDAKVDVLEGVLPSHKTAPLHKDGLSYRTGIET